MPKRVFWLSVVILAAAILVVYQPALRLGFYGDDYSFIEIAGRSSLPQYLSFYFDPRLQTGWYRPMQGMLFGIEWVLFGGDPFGYHLVNVLVHLSNCLLLFAVIGLVSKRWRIAFFAALIYMGLPLYGVAVFWPGDADFLLTFFYLLSILFWGLYLQQGRRRFYVLAFVFFLLGLTTKEFGITLPGLLFLVDRLLWREKIAFPALMWRYMPYVVAGLAYLPVEYYIQSRSVLTNLYGYSFQSHIVSNFVQYLAWLAFPWGLPEPMNYVWLVAAISLFGYVLFTKRSAPLLFLGIAAVLAFLPVIPFPWFFTRYLYMSVMATAVVSGLLFDMALTAFQRFRWFTSGAYAAIALIAFGNALGVAGAVADFAEISRQTRVPFRDIVQRHPGFPGDTFLYFVYPRSPTSELSGMFFLRFGTRVSVSSNTTMSRWANLRDHQSAYVIYFDEEQRTRELLVEQLLSVQTEPPVPCDFSEPIRLEGYELAAANVKRGQAIVLLLYWRGLRSIGDDYAVSVHLVDAAGKTVAGYEKEPRRGEAPTSTWKPGELIVDAVQLPVSTQVPPGTYRLEIALYDAATQQRIDILDEHGTPAAEKIVIETVRVIE